MEVEIIYNVEEVNIIPTGKKEGRAMKIQVVGTKRFDGEVEGKQYHQTTLYGIEQDFMQDGLIGYRVTTVKIRDEINPPPLEVGAEYLVYLGQPNAQGRAKVEFIQRCKG